MSDVSLREITDENLAAVVALRVAASQEGYVSSVADSLLEAEETPEGNPWCRLVAEIARDHGATELLTSFVVGDDSPAAFYRNVGFVPTGEEDGRARSSSP